MTAPRAPRRPAPLLGAGARACAALGLGALLLLACGSARIARADPSGGPPGGNSALPGSGGSAPAAAASLQGQPLGEFRLTYYTLAEAAGVRTSAAPGWLPVHGRDCRRVLAWVTQDFLSDLGLQGSGVLPDGRLLNFEQRCPCAAPTRGGERICYAELKRTDFPFGRGAKGTFEFFWLQPLRSVAVDPGTVPLGTVLYVPALEGRPLLQGLAHNGCVRAEDTGRAIRGRHLDLFAGGTRQRQGLAARLPRGPVAVFLGGRKCTGAFP